MIHSSSVALALLAVAAAAEEAARGCIWDQTGCAQGCDSELMQSRCQLLSHDQDACSGDEGKLNRCVWSRGASELEEDDADADQLDALSCIWDMTGCNKGCNVDAMIGRCKLYEHDKAACQGDDGQQARCQWGKYVDRNREKLDELRMANQAMDEEAEQEQLVELDEDEETLEEDDEEEAEEVENVLEEDDEEEEAEQEEEEEVLEEEEDDEEEAEVLEEEEDDEEEAEEDEDVFEEDDEEEVAEDEVLDETFDGDEMSMDDEPVIENPDCVWDETGCDELSAKLTGQFCAQVMASRCGALSAMECSSSIGAFKRCMRKQRNQRQNEALLSLNVHVFDSEVSAVDTVLVLAGLLTLLVVAQQSFKCYKQRATKKLVTREPQYGTVQLINSHAEEAYRV